MTPSTSSGRARWEYHEDEDLSMQELNALGDEGWELVSVYNEPREHNPGFDCDIQHVNAAIYTFKRPKETPPPNPLPASGEGERAMEMGDMLAGDPPPAANRWHTCTECGAVDFEDSKAIGSTLGVSVALCPNCASKENGWLRVREKLHPLVAAAAKSRGYGA